MTSVSSYPDVGLPFPLRELRGAAVEAGVDVAQSKRWSIDAREAVEPLRPQARRYYGRYKIRPRQLISARL